ncbi:hypothetical protein [Streptomyces hoynatensis]|uniref:Transposase n=1 Tax=Streptomyces hoynatensis TaxID=1141874 RepID=A0A3A9YFK4_9ACTN|nr:hypothetical protein [Streptomyces hoynatensis]RKN35958.1 hypothetical protein D7294_30475 [Streptomyces hoynatensis]
MKWRIWGRTPKRRAHRCPPLSVVLRERDEAIRRLVDARAELREVAARAASNQKAWYAAEAHIGRLRRENGALRAELANARAVSVSAPVDLEETIQMPRPGVATVVPLWAKRGADRRGDA